MLLWERDGGPPVDRKVHRPLIESDLDVHKSTLEKKKRGGGNHRPLLRNQVQQLAYYTWVNRRAKLEKSKACKSARNYSFILL